MALLSAGGTSPTLQKNKCIKYSASVQESSPWQVHEKRSMIHVCLFLIYRPYDSTDYGTPKFTVEQQNIFVLDFLLSHSECQPCMACLLIWLAAGLLKHGFSLLTIIFIYFFFMFV